MKVNVKETKNFFNSTVNDVKNISIQCTQVLNNFRTVGWGQYANQAIVEDVENKVARYEQLLLEFRKNFPIAQNEFETLCRNYKNKSVDAVEFNWMAIEITQKLMNYVEYLGSNVMVELLDATNKKQQSYNPPVVAEPVTGVVPPTEANATNPTIH